MYLNNQLRHNSCIQCGKPSLIKLSNFSNVGLVKCEKCHFVFSEKIPSKKELIEYYSNEYERTNFLSPVTEKRYNELLNKFEPYRKNNRILDIGAGCGFFLKIAHQRGWEIYGTEIDESAVEKCEETQLKMSFGEIQDIRFPEDFFDVIVHIEVIEHVNNPNQYIQEISKILRPGGITYLSTPNFNAIHRYRLKEKYDVISYPNHLCYYTAKTLKQAFKAHGLEPIRIKTTGYSVTRLKTSKGTSNQSFVSETSDDEMLRTKIESNPLLKFFKWILNGCLNIFKVGDSLKGTFIKK